MKNEAISRTRAGRKWRRTVAMVTASASLTVVGPLVHAAGAAQNTGAFDRSSAALKLNVQDACDLLWSWFEQDVNAAAATSNTSARDGLLDSAQNEMTRAKNMGCDWSFRITNIRNNTGGLSLAAPAGAVAS
jgi:hypothetical protein